MAKHDPDFKDQPLLDRIILFERRIAFQKQRYEKQREVAEGLVDAWFPDAPEKERSRLKKLITPWGQIRCLEREPDSEYWRRSVDLPKGWEKWEDYFVDRHKFDLLDRLSVDQKSMIEEYAQRIAELSEQIDIDQDKLNELNNIGTDYGKVSHTTLRTVFSAPAVEPEIRIQRRAPRYPRIEKQTLDVAEKLKSEDHPSFAEPVIKAEAVRAVLERLPRGEEWDVDNRTVQRYLERGGFLPTPRE